MKKYIKPTTDIILIDTQLIIADSLGKDSTGDPIDDNNEVLSRRGRDFWDE